MLTLKLWRALGSPARDNPVWQRISAHPASSFFLVRWLSGLLEFTSPFVQIVVLILSPLLLTLGGNLYGLALAVNISDAIGRERQQHTYELLALTPPGIGRASWLICSASAERWRVFTRVNTLRALAVGILLISGLATIGRSPSGLVYSGVLLLVLGVDAMQSVIVGCLSGLMAQLCASDLFSMRTWALGIFLAAQVFLAYFAAFGLVYLLSEWSSIQERTVLVVLYAVFLFIIREMVIQVMWRTLERHLV